MFNTYNHTSQQVVKLNIQLRTFLDLFLIMGCEATNGKASLMSCCRWIMVFSTYNISKKNERNKCTFFCIICNGGTKGSWVIHICIFVTHVSRSISVRLHDSQNTHTCIKIGAELLYGPSPQKAQNIFWPYECNLICFLRFGSSAIQGYCNTQGIVPDLNPVFHFLFILTNLIEPTKE